MEKKELTCIVCPMSCHLEVTLDDNGEIVNVTVDEAILGEDGEVDLSKFVPITYDAIHHTYIALGEKVGNAFADGMELDK